MEAPSLFAVWLRTVGDAPDAVAVIDAGAEKAWSRRELADAAARWHTRWGAMLGGRLVVFAEPNGPRWFEVFFGLLQSGAIPVPADATEPRGSLDAVAAAVRADALWHDGELHDLAPRRRPRRAGTALIKLTSGSTGLPRARRFSPAQMLADGAQVCASMGIQEMDLNLAVIPLGHSYGLGNLVMPLLAQGTPVVCSASPLPQALAADCARWRPTVFPAVPTLLRALVRSDVDPAALASLRLVISAGAPLDADIAAQFFRHFHRRVHSFYGTSETGGITFDRSGEAALSGRSVGTPLDGVRLRFRADGRFTVESAAVMSAGRYSPPDRAALSPEGELVLHGRVGRSMKIAGRRLDPAEVERALISIAGVRGACVFEHPDRADALAAVVATGLSVPMLRAALARQVAGWKIPERLVIVVDLPATARGKLDRVALRALLRR